MSLKVLIQPFFFAALFVPPMTAESVADKSSVAVNGSINGTVKDTAGAVLQGAQIVLQPSGATVISDAQGRYFLSNIKAGTYSVTISYIGFTT